jgi:hypothetical protein
MAAAGTSSWKDEFDEYLKDLAKYETESSRFIEAAMARGTLDERNALIVEVKAKLAKIADTLTSALAKGGLLHSVIENLCTKLSNLKFDDDYDEAFQRTICDLQKVQSVQRMLRDRYFNEWHSCDKSLRIVESGRRYKFTHGFFTGDDGEPVDDFSLLDPLKDVVYGIELLDDNVDWELYKIKEKYYGSRKRCREDEDPK